MSVAKEQREKLIWEFPNIGKKDPGAGGKGICVLRGI